MASVKMLIPYLEQGLTLGGGFAETLTPDRHGGIEWHREAAPGRPADSQYYRPGEFGQFHSVWDWSVQFLDASGKEYGLSDIGQIDAALKEHRSRYIYGTKSM